jgi:hypothetical protein
MDERIRNRTNTEIRQIIENTRAGIKSTITSNAVLRELRALRFIPLANFNIKMRGAQLYRDSPYGLWKTNKCSHQHKTKKNARMCLKRYQYHTIMEMFGR